MLTIGEIAKELIQKTPFLEEALAEELINISSLARKLKPLIEDSLQKKIKEGAVIMATKRMTPGYEFKLNFGLQQFVNNLGDYIIQSGLMHYTFENSKTLALRQRDLIAQTVGDQIYYSASRGIFETTIIVSNSTTDLVDKLFANEKLIFQKYSLSSITLRLSLKRTETTGFYFYILKELALEKINIEELISTTNEFTILVSDKDIDRAFSTLMRLKKNRL
ncbi:MAG: aspartate kinase [Bacteroidetes bacterium]|nr:MAG: aspartate kinase [Bacteroidota bacterium]